MVVARLVDVTELLASGGGLGRAPSVDLGASVPTITSGSDQAVPRHPTRFA